MINDINGKVGTNHYFAMDFNPLRW